MRYLYASLATAMIAAAAVPAVAGTLLVPQKFPTIQAAVNAAKPYDTILVSAKPKGGVYSEAVTIATPHVTLQGVGNPVIDGSGFTPTTPSGAFYAAYPNAIDIRANSVTVSGLTIQNVPGPYYGTGGAAINAGYMSADDTASYGFSNLQISGVTLNGDCNGIIITGLGFQLANGVYTFTSAQNFSLTGSTITGSTNYAANITSTNNLLISGNKFIRNNGAGLDIGGGFSQPTLNGLVTGNLFKSNGSDGMDAYGTGLTVAANESASNMEYGILVDTVPFSFSGTSAAPADAASTSVVSNSVHDNGLYGLYIDGTQTVSANLIAKNGSAGIVLEGADGSTIAGNAISGTTLASGNVGDGAGIFADYPTAANGADSKLKIALNQISGNTGDGIYINGYAGGVISSNSVVKNQGIGIHLSDITYQDSYYGYPAAPTTVTQNVALHNALFDARDDASATDTVTGTNGYPYYGDGAATINIWTKNVFGTTDPVGLSK